jgi:hypothetical protein
MEQLIKIKDNKIQSLVTKLQQAGIVWVNNILIWDKIEIVKISHMMLFNYYFKWMNKWIID